MLKQLSLGCKVKLIEMPFDPDPIAPGTIGIVTMINDIGHSGNIIGVLWENGRTLNLIDKLDEYEIIEGDGATAQ